MGMTLSMEEKVQTAAETVINASAADETGTGPHRQSRFLRKG